MDRTAGSGVTDTESGGRIVLTAAPTPSIGSDRWGLQRVSVRVPITSPSAAGTGVTGGPREAGAARTIPPSRRRYFHADPW